MVEKSWTYMYTPCSVCIFCFVLFCSVLFFFLFSFFPQRSSKHKFVPSMVLTQRSCQTKEIHPGPFVFCSHKSHRDNKQPCQSWSHANVQPTYEKGQGLRRLKSQVQDCLHSAKSTLPQHSALAGITQASVFSINITGLQFHENKIVMKKTCFSTQLHWQNVTPNIMLLLAVIVHVLKSLCPYKSEMRRVL